MDFSLADILFRVNAPAGTSPLCAPDEYAPFLTVPDDRPPDAVYEAHLIDTRLSADSPASPYFWDNGLWRTRVCAEQHLEIEILDVGAGGWRKAARLSPDFSSGKLWAPNTVCHPAKIRPLYHPQDRAIIIGRLCHMGGVMMHSSCVLAKGKVMLFSGMSGAGKTTLARLWREHGATILNDERNLLHPRNGLVRAGASPWHGEENQVNPATGPLAAIFFLKQAASNHLRPMPLAESLGRMMTTAFVPVYIPDGPARTLDACAAILEKVPAYELSFTPDARALDICRSVL